MGRDKKTGSELVPISTRVPSDLKAAIDRWLADQRIPPSITDVMVTAVREFLEREGYWPEGAVKPKKAGE